MWLSEAYLIHKLHVKSQDMELCSPLFSPSLML